MKKEILDYIKQLSQTDEKNLTQKTLKAGEEFGELAKVVLPFENAFATTHRFIDRSRILEEVADCLLVVYSVAYEIGATDEEIEQMVAHKMRYWADLQAREGRIKYPIPYEIHVTVAAGGTDIDAFKNACKELSVKPILLDLHLKDGAVVKDLMTSSTFMGNNPGAFKEMKRISEGLGGFGYRVLREKIETIPWHPAAPSEKHQNPVMPPNCYFECHLNVLCTEDRKEALSSIANIHGARRSSNVFKRFEDGSFTIMVTYRNYETKYEEFTEKLEKIKTDLAKYKFEVEKEIIEFSIYDTRVSHDSAWIEQT